MNWTWAIRSRDGAMNGLEFTRCTTAGGFERVLVHAAPAQMSVEILDHDGSTVAKADLDRDGEYSPMTLLERQGKELSRSECWPAEEHLGMLVLLAGGEAAVLQRWEHAGDHSWWRWNVEFSNHTGRPADWAPEGQSLKR
jgi:hypothetical protein